MESLEERFWSKVQKTSGCWIWTKATTSRGYGYFRLNKNDGGRRMVLAHRMAYALTYGVPSAEKVVRHTCDNPICCRPDHLLIGTQADNAADAVSRNRGMGSGRKLHGEENPNAKLTRKQVQEIRMRLALGEQGKEIAGRFGVTDTTISYIKQRRTWI